MYTCIYVCGMWNYEEKYEVTRKDDAKDRMLSATFHSFPIFTIFFPEYPGAQTTRRLSSSRCWWRRGVDERRRRRGRKQRAPASRSTKYTWYAPCYFLHAGGWMLRRKLWLKGSVLKRGCMPEKQFPKKKKKKSYHIVFIKENKTTVVDMLRSVSLHFFLLPFPLLNYVLQDCKPSLPGTAFFVCEEN